MLYITPSTNTVLGVILVRSIILITEPIMLLMYQILLTAQDRADYKAAKALGISLTEYKSRRALGLA